MPDNQQQIKMQNSVSNKMLQHIDKCDIYLYLCVHVWHRQIVEDEEDFVLQILRRYFHTFDALLVRQQCVDISSIRHRRLHIDKHILIQIAH